jgi:hypothetical protein
VALTIYGFHNRPKSFAVTKVGAPIEECPFLLDFSRKLSKYRWLGFNNRWVGVVVALGVPIVHVGQATGEYEILVHRTDGYFQNILALWKENFPMQRQAPKQQVDGLEIIAAFGRHFPGNC